MNRAVSPLVGPPEVPLPLARLLSSREVSAILRVPVRTLDHYAYMGMGPKFFKIGKHRRYHPDDIQSWMTSLRAE